MSEDPRLLPPNSTPLERAVDATGAARLGALPVFVRHLWNAATCPPAWLPTLAWALSVDLWRSEWPEALKRRVIAASPLVHRLKGTVAAVRAAAEAIAGASPVRLIEWFQAGGSGRPYTARIEADLTDAAGSPDAGPELPRDLRAAVESSANLRSRFEIRLTARPEAGERVASRIRTPVARGSVAGETPVIRPFERGLAIGSHLGRPAARGRLAGSISVVRPLAGGTTTAAHIRRPATQGGLTVKALPLRPFHGAVQAAGHIRTPAVGVHIIVSGA